MPAPFGPYSSWGNGWIGWPRTSTAVTCSLLQSAVPEEVDMKMSGRPATMFRPEIINQPRVLEFLRYLFTRRREIDEHDAQHAGAKEGFRDSMRLKTVSASFASQALA